MRRLGGGSRSGSWTTYYAKAQAASEGVESVSVLGYTAYSFLIHGTPCPKELAFYSLFRSLVSAILQGVPI